MKTKRPFTARKSKSLFKGVYPTATGWRAAVTIYSGEKGVSRHIGVFPTAKKAFDARCEFLDALK